MSLRVWLPLNGNLNSIGLDRFTATNNGATTSASGKIGSCYTFGGSNYITLPTSVLSSFTNEISVCAWINVSAWNSQYDSIIKMYATNNAWNNSIFAMGRNGTTHRLYFSIASGSASTQGSCTLTFDQSLSTWYHIACVYNYTDKNMKIYLNGALQTTYSTTIVPNFSIVTSIGLGGSPLASYGLKGSLNDVRIYNHALSAQEVKEISQGLVLHYKLCGVNDGMGFNLLRSTPKSITPTTYLACQLNMTENLVSGQTYTLQLWDVNVSHSNKTADQLGVAFYWGGGSIKLGTWTGTSYFTDGHADHLTKTFTITSSQASDTGATNAWLNLYNSYPQASGTMNLSIGKWKLEKGSTATAWTPSALDQGVDLTRVADCSGYSNDGTIIGTLTYAADSPRYHASIAVPSGAHYIDAGKGGKVSDAITVSLWCKYSTWGNPISCTEGGGWNFENNSSYISFPVYVSGVGYKVAKSTYAPADLQNAWHMITGTFDRTDVKIYIDGVLSGSIETGSTNGIGYNANNPIDIAAEASGSSTPASTSFVGNISDVRIYATALSADDIQALYHTSANIDNMGRMHAFEFNDANGAREIFNDYATWTSTTDTTTTGITYDPATGLTFKGYCAVYYAYGYPPGYYEILNTGYTYQYDLEYSNTAGNQLYIGFERYDANKTATSNSSTVYIVSTKVAHENTKVTGTVNLSKDVNNATVKYIKPRILNNWSGSTTTGVENVASIKYFTLREVPATGNQIQSVGKNGVTSCEEMIENESANFHKNGIIETIEFIEY